MRYFSRRVVVTVTDAQGDAIRCEGLRVQFRAKINMSGFPDPTDIVIYNAPESVFGKLQAAGTVTELLAGYGDQLTQVARGQVVFGSLRGPERRGADNVLTWQVRDLGGTAYASVWLARAWVGSVSTREILEAIAGDAGIPIAGISIGDRSVTYTRGYNLFGSVRQALDDVVADAALTYTITRGRLYVWQPDQPRTRTVEVFSASSGLLEPPVRVNIEGRWRCRVLLRPGIQPGDYYRIDAEQGRGDYIVDEVEHSGDSLGYDSDYSTTITGRPLRAPLEAA